MATIWRRVVHLIALYSTVKHLAGKLIRGLLVASAAARRSAARRHAHRGRARLDTQFLRACDTWIRPVIQNAVGRRIAPHSNVTRVGIAMNLPKIKSAIRTKSAASLPVLFTHAMPLLAGQIRPQRKTSLGIAPYSAVNRLAAITPAARSGCRTSLFGTSLAKRMMFAA